MSALWGLNYLRKVKQLSNPIHFEWDCCWLTESCEADKLLFVLFLLYSNFLMSHKHDKISRIGLNISLRTTCSNVDVMAYLCSKTSMLFYVESNSKTLTLNKAGISDMAWHCNNVQTLLNNVYYWLSKCDIVKCWHFQATVLWTTFLPHYIIILVYI